MSIRSKLFATVALPVFAASLAAQPALADRLNAPFEVAQEGGEELSPEELLLLKKRQQEQRQAEEEQQGAEEEQQRQAEEEQQRAAEEEQQRQAEEEQQRAAEEEKQRQAEEEQQRAAEEEKQRQAEEEQQRAAEEEKQRQAEEEQQRAAEEEKQRQAEEEQQRAAEEEKQRQAEEEQQRAAEEEKQRQAEEELQRAAEEEKQRQAEEEQQRAAEEEKQRQAEEEQQRAAEEEQQPQAEEEQQRAAEEEQQPQAEEEQQRAAEEEPADVPTEQTGEAEEQPQPEGEEPATAEGEQPEGEPAAEVVDERTVEEKQKIAEDPAATDETVVLPVERGAAVLDSDKDADNFGGDRAREIRRQQREELRAKEEAVEPPSDDAAAQAEIPAEVREALPQKIEAALSEEGERVEEAPEFAVPETTNIVNNTVINNTTVNNTTVNNTTTTNVTEVRVVEQTENRVILEAGDRIFVRGDDRPRLRHDAEETFYEELPRDRYRETIVRPGGYRIVTIYDRYGGILQRTRIDREGTEYVLIYAPEYEEERRRPTIVDVGYELPPMRLNIPVDEYIVDYAEEPDLDYYEFLSEPPVERVERVYTIDEVRHSARLRDKVRRIDLDTITFATGSAEVSMSQAKTLRKVADAMAKVLDKDPGETFFIEGHTDAVGSDRSNLLLSDRRADSVASLLSEVYGIPPENLVTQGYGERFLKIRTQEAEQENRRVTIRRVTPLVRPVAQR
ncbi:outer membrane protein OmpA-like peptidoglycan-associated protein [Sinorhizobium kostiense]|uniref:Outer membrane protein OmpA-like peptidoglycan-associated protein n=1 Tax=Sinorhizobium kostiense TaxID=76747 RepID=A0ABS4R9B9_9HYPH|nr:OmpA family protein [Sinorhizobium kostiense]MBP2238427.1 outer membrane protein OmpA-like peptidoglycan-associated protein [Sinorhizobium kostiense]